MRRLAWALAVLGVLPVPATGQSLFSGAGLGIPTDPVDARGRALGSVGIGLWDGGVSPTDPAAAAGLVLPTVVFSAQPSWVDFGREDTGEAASFRSTRFPVIGVAYPAWNLGMATLTMGSFLDQRYEATRQVRVDLIDGPVNATDVFTSEGGVAEVRLGFARPLSETVAVGVSVGRYNGTSVRRLVRSLEGVTAEGTVLEFQNGGRWSYSGTSLTGGASVLVGGIARLAGSVTWSSELKAEASQDTQGADRSFSIPLQVRLGASAELGSGLALAASFASADWSGTDADLSRSGVAQGTNSFGVGVELSRARLLGRSAPLRFGYRRSDLPFALEGGDPSESAWTFGLGLALSQTGEITLAGLDLAMERGERVEGAISESFWRGTLSLRVAGF